MKAICTDMAAEQQALDAIFADLDEPGWNIVTPADGWDIREQIRHLAYYENRAGWRPRIRTPSSSGWRTCSRTRKDLLGTWKKQERN